MAGHRVRSTTLPDRSSNLTQLASPPRRPAARQRIVHEALVEADLRLISVGMSSRTRAVFLVCIVPGGQWEVGGLGPGAHDTAG